MSDDPLSIVDDILGVLDAEPQQADERQTVLCLLEKDESRTLMKSVESFSDGLSFVYRPHTKEVASQLDDVSLILIECRLLEGLQDLNLIRRLRTARPQIPIVALGLNDDDEYISSAYEAGVSDYIVLPAGPLVVLRKIDYLKDLAKRLHILEVKNNEVIEIMRSLRQANQNLKTEKSVRMAAETERDFAKEAALVNQQMKEILDNLREAFFFVKPDMSIGDSTSRACETIFGEELAHKVLGDILGLTGQAELSLRLGLEQLFEDFMPREVCLDLLPKTADTVRGLHLEFRYTAVENSQGQIEKVIIAASDITDLVKAKAHFQKEANHNKTLLHILQNRESFKDFMYDYKSELDRISRQDDPTRVKRALHTLKGNSAIFKLEELAARIHQWEDQLNALGVEDWPLEELKYELSHWLESFLEHNREILHLSYKLDEGHHFQISEGLLNQILQLLESPNLEIAVRGTRRMLNRVRLKPLHELLAVYDTTIERLADKLEKRIKFHKVHGAIYLHSDRFQPLFKVLIHAINNACDHGIESPVERLERGKLEVGHVFLRIEIMNDEALRVVIMDDGKGIDTELVSKKALAKGLVDEVGLQSMSHSEIYELIFANGFSTAETITDTSGRGVGMAAVREVIETLNANLRVQSKVGVGTKITIDIPVDREEYEVDEPTRPLRDSKKLAA